MADKRITWIFVLRQGFCASEAILSMYRPAPTQLPPFILRAVWEAFSEAVGTFNTMHRWGIHTRSEQGRLLSLTTLCLEKKLGERVRVRSFNEWWEEAARRRTRLRRMSAAEELAETNYILRQLEEAPCRDDESSLLQRAFSVMKTVPCTQTPKSPSNDSCLPRPPYTLPSPHSESGILA